MSSKYRQRGMAHSVVTIEIPSLRFREYIEAFARGSQRSGTLRVRIVRIDNYARIIILELWHTCVNGFTHRGDGDFKYNVQRWNRRARQKIGGSTRILDYGAITWKPTP